MTKQEKIAKHFGVLPSAVAFTTARDEKNRARRGWFIIGSETTYLGPSLHEVQCSPNWSQAKSNHNV